MLETRGLEPGAVPHFFDWVARALAIYPDTGMGSLLGSISAALTAAFSALLIARYINWRIERHKATLEFSNRFQNSRRTQHELNRKYLYTDRGEVIASPVQTPRDRADAVEWYRNFFDLMQSQLDYYVAGLLTKKRFIEWMKWRRHEFSTNPDVCGLGYRDGWTAWKDRPPLKGEGLIKFLDGVHRSPQRVESLVFRLRMWKLLRCILIVLIAGACIGGFVWTQLEGDPHGSRPVSSGQKQQ